jgi:tetratricopeptide (TPR) repeat protein
MRVRGFKLIAVSVLASVCLVLAARRAASDDGRDIIGARPAPPPTSAFSPSNARTEDGRFIHLSQFFPAARCLSCHRDTHAAWSQSLHRNAARAPFYRESADILLRTRGIEFTRHCESCHAPVALFTGALTKENIRAQAPFTPLDDEGVTCSVCHSITDARTDGTGSYTIRAPALLAREDGTTVAGDVSDQQILADVPGHRRAVMRPLLKRPEFCGVCHKSSAPPELNGYKALRGFSAYDEWQQSGASHEAVTPFYRRAERADCRACHMPKVGSRDDRAAKNGSIASHRWLGANTATPLFYGQTEQVEATEKFLKADVLAIDIFAATGETNAARVAPLVERAENCIALRPGQEVTVEVVVSNRNAAHSFPPELRDLYESWVEFEAVDSGGKTIFHSGFVRPDQSLDETAHVYKQILLDESGRPITRHQVWLSTIKAYDNAIPQGRSDLVRFRFRIPGGEKNEPAAQITLRARVNYRRFIKEYADYVLKNQKAQLALPIVRMAEAEAKIVAVARADFEDEQGMNRKAVALSEARRWNDYGIALLEQAQYGAAAHAFRRAAELDPADPNFPTSAAIAEMKTEWFGPVREQWRKAARLLDEALKIAPSHARTRYWRTILLRGEGKTREAAREMAELARDYPRDREVQRQLGQTLFALGQIAEAREAFEAVLAIDPTDAVSYQFLTSIHASVGQNEEAARANRLYLLWRDDPRADRVAIRFFTSHPEWVDERISSHVHSIDSPKRPTLTAPFAAPDK